MPPRSSFRVAPLDDVAAHPLGHQPDDRMLARAEFGRSGSGQIGQIARRLDDRHVHAKADAEIRHAPLASKARGLDHPFGAALPKAAGDKDAVHAFELADRLGLGLEHLRIDPFELDPDPVGDAAMRHRLGERFIAVRQLRVLADDGDRHLTFRLANAADDIVPPREIGLGRRRSRNGGRLRGRTPRRSRRAAPHRSCRHRAPG